MFVLKDLIITHDIKYKILKNLILSITNILNKLVKYIFIYRKNKNKKQTKTSAYNNFSSLISIHLRYYNRRQSLFITFVMSSHSPICRIKGFIITKTKYNSIIFENFRLFQVAQQIHPQASKFKKHIKNKLIKEVLCWFETSLAYFKQIKIYILKRIRSSYIAINTDGLMQTTIVNYNLFYVFINNSINNI
ncbi:hypothetical protein FF38_01495 [Lucilia cuprina]|uniref:Uncharacterized protein n=1 Tax=Lucilia cuprina TaxID=7375 RepID=A0A0L0CQ28_LUCCU|nr:hypothetical protein FF38_01495 [Lucilia cuprina]